MTRKTTWALSLLLALEAGVTLVSIACGGAVATVAKLTTTNLTMSDPATCAGPTGPFSHMYVTVKDVEHRRQCHLRLHRSHPHAGPETDAD